MKWRLFMWLLVVEDDRRVADMLRRGLEEEGYSVDLASDGVAGQDLARLNAYDALIIDWRLPKLTGEALIRSIRAEGAKVPILMLTALGDIAHRVAGLDAGADDYLCKPFAFEELLARLRALLRRPLLARPDEYVKIGPLELDTARRQARALGAVIPLRPKEYALLEVFMCHPNAVFSRTALAERIWGSAYSVSDNVIDVTVSGLRGKLATALADSPPQEDAHAHPSITTVRGVGFQLSAPGTVSDQ